MAGKITRISFGTMHKNTRKYTIYTDNFTISAGGEATFTSDGEINYGEPQEKDRLRVIKLEGPLNEEREKEEKPIPGNSYWFKATFSKKAKRIQITQLKWQMKTDEGTYNLRMDYSTIKEDTQAIYAYLPYKKMQLYAYFIEPTDAVSIRCHTTPLKLPMVIDRYKMPGLDKDGTDIAEDMGYGTGYKYKRNIYPKEVVNQYKKEYKENGFNPKKHTLFSNTTRLSEVENSTVYDKEEVLNLHRLMRLTESNSDADLFADFRILKDHMVWGKLSPVLDEMIDKFEKNKGGIYQNEKLTESVKNNPSTQRYCIQVENYMAQKIKDYFVHDQEIEDTEPDFFDIRKRRAKNKITGKKDKDNMDLVFTTPLYPYTRDNNLIEGRTLALNDIWATEVILKTLEFTGNNYTGKYQVTLWDHFGLDKSDMEKFFVYGTGFRAWFILQHLRGYRPFITKMVFEKTFTGNIKEGLKERLNKK